MTFQTKLRVDYWVGGFLLALLFVPVRALGLTLRRDHGLTRRRGCAVIKLIGAGSLFLAMPSMLEIRRRFPEAGSSWSPRRPSSRSRASSTGSTSTGLSMIRPSSV